MTILLNSSITAIWILGDRPGLSPPGFSTCVLVNASFLPLFKP